MKNAIRRVGLWILMHPRLVTAVAVAALAFAAFAMPAMGIARPRWKP